MATLITYQSSGGDKGRCDAKCYNATHPNCNCICGGANHGKGLATATENTARLAQHWLDEYQKSHPGEQVEMKMRSIQTAMFAETGGE